MKHQRTKHIGSTSPRREGRATLLPGSRTVLHDPRWPAIASALERLHEEGRFSIRIVDADCGAGSLLIHAAHHARAIGYTAVEARGIDGSPALIGRARAAMPRVANAGIGLTFDLVDVRVALHEEADAPADIVLWHGERHASLDAALADAAALVIDDHGLVPVGIETQ